MKITWRDWWASRTIKFNNLMGVVWAAVLPVIVLWDEADWENVGLSKQMALIFVLIIQVLERIGNNELRKRTKTSLNVRADVGP